MLDKSIASFFVEVAYSYDSDEFPVDILSDFSEGCCGRNYKHLLCVLREKVSAGLSRKNQ